MLRLQERMPTPALSPFDWLGLHDTSLSATGKHEGGVITEDGMPSLDFVYHASAVFARIISRMLLF